MALEARKLEMLRHLVEQPWLRSQIKPEHVSKDEGDPMRIFFATMQSLDRQGSMVTWENLLHIARKYNRQDMVEIINDARETPVLHGASFLANTLREEFNLAHLFKLFNEGLRMIGEGYPSDDIDSMMELNRRALVTDTRHISMESASDSTIRQLESIWNGEKPAIWKTGHEMLDMAIGWGPRMTTMIAASQKQGKSRFTVDLVMRMLERNPGLDVQWYSFEMRPEEMMVCVLAWITGIGTKIISGRGGMPNEEQKRVIREARKYAQALNIKFFNTKVNMDTLRRDIKSNGASETSLIVVDNVGLVRQDPGRTDNQHDDYMSAEFVDIRDTCGPQILLLHHLSKANESDFRKKELFQPRQSDMRGSNRWGDYVNSLIMLHRVEQYPLLQAEMTPEAWNAAKGKMSAFVPLSRGSEPMEIIFEHNLATCRMKEYKRVE